MEPLRSMLAEPMAPKITMNAVFDLLQRTSKTAADLVQHLTDIADRVDGGVPSKNRSEPSAVPVGMIESLNDAIQRINDDILRCNDLTSRIDGRLR